MFKYERGVMKNLRSISPPQEFNQEHEHNMSASFTLQPKFRDLNVLIFRQKEASVSFDEFYSFIRKLYITEDPDQCLQLFRQVTQQDSMDLLEFNQFLQQDILKVDFTKISQSELVLRVGLEIFYTLSDSSGELDLRRTLSFIKEDLQEDIDFLETMDMFGFVQDLYSGQFINKIPLLQFFQKTAPQIKKSLSSILIKKIQQIIGFKIKFHTRQRNHVQVPDAKNDIQSLLQKNFNINFEVEIEEQKKSQPQQEQLISLLQTSKPKIRGWLQRLSTNKANKWQLLFLQIDQGQKVLKAIKSENIKKTHHLLTTDFTCLEQIIQVKGNHRKTNSLTFQAQKEEQNRNVHTENASINSITPFSHVFILHEHKSTKFTLIRTWDIREIEQIVQEYKSNFDEQQNYSGIVDVAFINQDTQEKIKQKFKTIQFKEYLMIIKDGKIIIYNAKMKHQIDLRKMRIENQSGLPFIPSHPFPFQVIIIDEQQTHQYIKVQKKIEQEEPQSVVMWQIDEDENENSDKDDPKKGFFDQIYDKIKRKPTKKKELRIVFAAESEPKRRQWIFSLNYYRTCNSDLGDLLKPSQRSSFQTPCISLGNQTPQKSYVKSINNTQPQFVIQGNQNVFVGGNHTQINVGIFNLGGDDDYYDVFKAENQAQKRNQSQQKQSFSKGHCHTDPNEHIVKECIKYINSFQKERLVTLPSNGGQTSNRQIFTTSALEVWQQFIVGFFKYIVKQKNQSLDGAQEPKVQTIYNRQLKINKQK